MSDRPMTYEDHRMTTDGYCLLALKNACVCVDYNEREVLATILETPAGIHSVRTLYGSDFYFRGTDLETVTVVTPESAELLISDRNLERVL